MKDIEVLMLADHLDEPCIQKPADYIGKKLVSIQEADVKLDETNRRRRNPLSQRICTSLSQIGGKRSLLIHLEGCPEGCRCQD